MKTTKTVKSILLLGSILTIATPNLVLAATVNKSNLPQTPEQAIKSPLDKVPDGKLKTPELKPLLDAKTLEQNFLNGASRLRVGGNSGGGGDDVGMDFQKTMHEALGNLQVRMPEVYRTLEKHNLATLASNAKVIVVDDALDVGVKGYIQNSVAVNLPETQVILVNRSRWNAVRDSKLREGIALHEILSLKKLESTGVYPISSKYLSIHGARAGELVASLGVNRMQQIKTLAPKASPFEVLEKFYNEANAAIDFEDIREIANQDKYDCAEVSALGSSYAEPKTWEYMNSPRAFFVSIFEDDTNPEMGAKESYGPLFPAHPENHESRKERFNIRLSVYDYIFKYHLESVTMTASATEINETSPYAYGLSLRDSIGDTTVSARKNNGLVVFKILSKSNDFAEKTIKLVFGYCYPKAKK